MDFKSRGNDLRNKFKDLVLDFMQSKEECQSLGRGIKQAHIFRECGMDWGEKSNCTSTNQQYWIVAILRTLENEGKVERDSGTKKWRLK